MNNKIYPWYYISRIELQSEILHRQVPGVTEEIAIAVLDLYPTLFSLAQAYSRLVSFTSHIDSIIFLLCCS